MKKRLKYLAAIFLIAGCSSISSDQGNSTPEELGKSVLNALKKNDKELFSKYVYTEHEVAYFIEHYGKPIDSARQYRRLKEYRPKLIERFDQM